MFYEQLLLEFQLEAIIQKCNKIWISVTTNYWKMQMFYHHLIIAMLSSEDWYNVILKYYIKDTKCCSKICLWTKRERLSTARLTFPQKTPYFPCAIPYKIGLIVIIMRLNSMTTKYLTFYDILRSKIT